MIDGALYVRELLTPENRTKQRSTDFGFDLGDPHRPVTSLNPRIGIRIRNEANHRGGHYFSQ